MLRKRPFIYPPHARAAMKTIHVRCADCGGRGYVTAPSGRLIDCRPCQRTGMALSDTGVSLIGAGRIRDPAGAAAFEAARAALAGGAHS